MRIKFNSLLYKTNRFHVAVGLFSNRSHKTSKCGKNISDTLGYWLVCHFFVLTTFWSHLWSITEQTHGKWHGIYLLIISVTWNGHLWSPEDITTWHWINRPSGVFWSVVHLPNLYRVVIDLFTDTAAILISIVSNSYYGMPRGQIHVNLPPEHPIMSFETIEIKMAAVSVKRSIG